MSQPSRPPGFVFPPQHHGLYRFDDDENNLELLNKVTKDDEQPWKRWFLVSDEHPLESGKYNFGGTIVYKPPAIVKNPYFSTDRVFHPTNDEYLAFATIKIETTSIVSNWIRKHLKIQTQFDENILKLIIKYLLFVPLSWHTASQEVTEDDGTINIIEPNTIIMVNAGVNIALMDYVCDWNHEYYHKKEETFGVKLTLKEFNNPYAFGFGFIVINHFNSMPYISDWNYFMDYTDTNVGFGVFFVKQHNNKYQMKAFCEPRLYQNYMIIRRFRDGLFSELCTGDEIKFILNHKTDISTLYINDNKISDVFFGTPPYCAPAIHYVGAPTYFGFSSADPVGCVFQCDFAFDEDDEAEDEALTLNKYVICVISI